MTLLDDCCAAYMAHTAPNRSVKSMKADPRSNIEAIIAPAVARIAELEAMEWELADLHDSIRTLYIAMPHLPITNDTMHAGTDSLHGLCLAVGIHGVEIGLHTERTA